MITVDFSGSLIFVERFVKCVLMFAFMICSELPTGDDGRIKNSHAKVQAIRRALCRYFSG